MLDWINESVELQNKKGKAEIVQETYRRIITEEYQKLLSALSKRKEQIIEHNLEST